MKKQLLIFILAMLPFGGHSQTENQDFSKDYYLQKSKSQENAGWVLLGAGAAMGIGGIIIVNQGDIFSADFEAGAILVLGGAASALASIPFFISSGSNSRKAARLSFIPQKYIFPNREFPGMKPALSLKIDF
ncbi:MAG: hypothetical protein ABJ092_08795 [Gillisia sp.]